MRWIPLWGYRGIIRDWVKVDDEDFDALNQYVWHLGNAGYAASWEKRLMHRELLGLMTGDGRYGDHINHDKLDNRRANLRIVTNAENMQNRRPRRLGSSQYRGVTWDKRTQRWIAQGMLNGRTYFLGRFDDEDVAGAAAAEFRAQCMPLAA